MFGYNPYQKSYGPVNALADILGAYWQKKATDGAYDYVDQASQKMDDALKPKVQQTPVYSQDASQNIASSMMPTAGSQPDFLLSQQNNSAPGNQSLLAAVQRYAAENPNKGAYQNGSSGSLLDAMNKYQSTADPSSPQNQVGQPAVNSQQYNFTNPMQQQYGFQNDKPAQAQSYSQASATLKGMIPGMMKDLVTKYGLENAQKVFPIMQQSMNDKLSSFADTEYNRNMQAMAPYLLGDLSTPAAKRQALWGIVNFNNAAKRLGRDGLDVPTIQKMLATNDVVTTTKDAGDSIQIIAAPKDGSAFDDGSYVKVVGVLPKGATPDARLKDSTERFKWTTPSANNTQDNNTKIQTTSMNNATTIQAAGIKSSGNGTKANANTLNALKGVISDYGRWVSAHKMELQMGDLKESDYPNYGNYQKAQAAMAQMAGLDNTASASSGQHSDATGDPVADYINEAYNRGYTKEQIQTALRQKGYGDSYDGYLWD